MVWGSCRSPNPITGTEQCLQQGINPTAHSPCSKPGGQKDGIKISCSCWLPHVSGLRWGLESLWYLINCNCGVLGSGCMQTINMVDLDALSLPKVARSPWFGLSTTRGRVPLPASLHLGRHNSYKGRKKKSNYHVDPQLSQRGELNISHNSVGVPSGSVDGNVTLGCNNKGF